MDELLKSLLPLAAGAGGIPFLLWRIYKYIDTRMREQIDELEARVTALENKLTSADATAEALRTQRITEVEAERVRRMAAEDQATVHRAESLVKDAEIRVLQSQLGRAGA